MKLIRLRADKVFSLGRINESLENLGLTMVTGFSHDENSANGAGKSSFTRNALLWGLYGQIMGGARGDDVINRHTNGKDCYVEIDFRGVDEQVYELVRTKNPNGLKLTCEDKDLSCKLEKDTQQLINKALGRDFKSFIQTDFFGQGRKLSFFELIPSEQKEIIDDILPLEYLTEWEAESKTAKETIQAKQRALEIEQHRLQGVGEQLTKGLPKLVESHRDWNDERDARLRRFKADETTLAAKFVQTQKHRSRIHKKISELIHKHDLDNMDEVTLHLSKLDLEMLEFKAETDKLQAKVNNNYET